MASGRSKAAFFRRTPWLAGLPAREIQRLSRASEALELPRKKAVWAPTDPADRVFWVRSGCVRVGRSGGDDRQLILRFHGRGDVFGVSALYSPRERGTSAVAHEECVLYATPVAELERLARSHGDLGLRLSDLLIERQRRLEARLAGLVFTPVKERLLHLFSELAGDFGVRDSRGVIIDLRLTHREMAALVGTTRETVSLTLVGLRKGGWIATENRRVVLLRPALSPGGSPGRRRRV